MSYKPLEMDVERTETTLWTSPPESHGTQSQSRDFEPTQQPEFQSRDYQLSAEPVVKEEEEDMAAAAPGSSTPLQSILTMSRDPSRDPTSDITRDMSKLLNSASSDTFYGFMKSHEKRFLQAVMQFNLTESPYSNYAFQFAGLDLQPDTVKLYDRFLTRFVPVITPPHSHPDLSSWAVLIPLVFKSPEILQLSFACGALDLAWHDPDMMKTVQKHYLAAIRALRNKIVSCEVTGSEDWLFSIVQLLTTFEKHFGSPTSAVVRHLSGAQRVLRERQMKRVYDGGEIFALNKNDRVLMEAFLYNYSVAILFCQKSDLVYLSPPSVFDEFRPYLQVALYETQVYWSNNPILGAGFIVFEMCAKISWIARKEILTIEDSQNIKSYIRALEIWSVPDIQKTHMTDELEYHSFMQHMYASRVMRQAVILLAKKLLNPDLKETSEEVVGHVTQAVEELKNIELGSYVSCIIGWAMALCGCAATEKTHRELFKFRVEKFGENSRAAIFRQVMKLYGLAWGAGEGERELGLDIIYEREVLESMAL